MTLSLLTGLTISDIKADTLTRISVAGGKVTIDSTGEVFVNDETISRGTISSGTEIYSTGNLVVENQGTASIDNIYVTGDLTLQGNGNLNVSSTTAVFSTLYVTGNFTLDSNLTVVGNNSRAMLINGNFTLNSNASLTWMVNDTNTTDRGVKIGKNAYIYGAVTGINNGAFMADGTIETFSSANISINTITSKALYSQNTITINGGVLDVTSSMDGLSAALDTVIQGNANVTATGANAGVSAGNNLVIDNSVVNANSSGYATYSRGTTTIRNVAVVNATSNNQGIYSYGDLIIETNASVTGIINNPTGSSSVAVRSANGKITTDSTTSVIAKGTPYAGVYARAGLDVGGYVESTGTTYGIFSVADLYARSNAEIYAIATNEDAAAYGLSVKGVTVDGGFVQGESWNTAVYSPTSAVLVQNDGTLIGIAEYRVDDTASIGGDTIDVDHSGLVSEKYKNDIVVIDDITSVNPYFNSLNMNHVDAYTWSSSAGEVKVADDNSGLLAVESAAQATLIAQRNYDASVNEVVTLSATGNNIHRIELLVSLEATPVETPNPDPEEPEVKEPDKETPDVEEPDTEKPDIKTPDTTTPDVDDTTEVKTPEQKETIAPKPETSAHNKSTFVKSSLANLSRSTDGGVNTMDTTNIAKFSLLLVVSIGVFALYTKRKKTEK